MNFTMWKLKFSDFHNLTTWQSWMQLLGWQQFKINSSAYKFIWKSSIMGVKIKQEE